MNGRDPHSYFDPSQARTRRFQLQARVDFEQHVLEGQVTLELQRAVASNGASNGASGGDSPSERLDLDTRDLEIQAVHDETGNPLPFTLHPAEPILGARLSITLPHSAARVTVRYRTSPHSSALQWLEPAQTAGQSHPFLFSQCQAIHARSVVPLQDTPRVRSTYAAELDVPAPLTAVMAAAALGERPAEPGRRRFAFEMPQPIPPYLFALAVGNLTSAELSPRSRVWAEPQTLPAAAHEFSGVEAMMTAAETLFGPYPWERFDLLTMPPSFPYGGMENPRLTFLTPTLLAGDRSLANVVAHELAHSWTGNLVTNADAEHFWLNEGFTVYAERRILEALEGPELCALHAAVGRNSLDDALARFANHPELTQLRTYLAGIDPDDAFSQIPYEKGYLFLRALEEAVGRAAFSAFVRKYIEHFRFQSITTDDFLAFLERELPLAAKRVDLVAWIDRPGLPADAPQSASARRAAIEALGAQVPPEAQSQHWSPIEWQLYLESLPRPAPLPLCEALEARYRLTTSSNFEVRVAWLMLATESGYEPAYAAVEATLAAVGRMKYLRPLYSALLKNPQTRERANALYQRVSHGYHPIARQLVEGLLKGPQVPVQPS